MKKRQYELHPPSGVLPIEPPHSVLLVTRTCPESRHSITVYANSIASSSDATRQPPSHTEEWYRSCWNASAWTNPSANYQCLMRFADNLLKMGSVDEMERFEMLERPLARSVTTLRRLRSPGGIQQRTTISKTKPGFRQAASAETGYFFMGQA